MIVYQLFESIQNYVVFIVAGIFTVTWHAISRPAWTRGERRKFVDVSVAVTFASRSNINLIIRDTSLSKCPTVDPHLEDTRYDEPQEKEVDSTGAVMSGMTAKLNGTVMQII